MNGFRKELENLINATSQENGSNTPDFILAEFLIDCLAAFDKASTKREDWYGHRHSPGQGEYTFSAAEIAIARDVAKDDKQCTVIYVPGNKHKIDVEPGKTTVHDLLLAVLKLEQRNPVLSYTVTDTAGYHIPGDAKAEQYDLIYVSQRAGIGA
jgi:hypothetical protein